METEDRRTVGTRSRVAALALVVALTGSLLLVAAPSAQATGPCDFGRGEDQGVRAYMRDVIRCAVDRWSVRGGTRTALCIAKRESGLLPWAESSDGINKGLYQQHVDYWANNYDDLRQARLGAGEADPERPHERDRVDPHGARRRLGSLGRQRLRLNLSPDHAARLPTW